MNFKVNYAFNIVYLSVIIYGLKIIIVDRILISVHPCYMSLYNTR